MLCMGVRFYRMINAVNECELMLESLCLKY